MTRRYAHTRPHSFRDRLHGVLRQPEVAKDVRAIEIATWAALAVVAIIAAMKWGTVAVDAVRGWM